MYVLIIVKEYSNKYLNINNEFLKANHNGLLNANNEWGRSYKRNLLIDLII